MADAYDVMSIAKCSGAALQQKEDWEAYQDELAAAASKRSKGGFWSGLANMGIAKLLPMLIPGVGAGAGLMSLLGVGAARAATQYGLGEAVRSMTGADTRAGAFKGTSTGPYGRKGAAHQKRQAEMISRTIGEELAGAKRGRGFMSLASSALADKEGWGDWAKNLGKGKEVTEAATAAGDQAKLMEFMGNQQDFAAEFGEGGGDPLGLKRMRIPTNITEFTQQAPIPSKDMLLDAMPDEDYYRTTGDFDFGGDVPNVVSGNKSIASVLPLSGSELSKRMPPQSDVLPRSAFDFGLPSTGSPLDTMNILQNIGGAYKPPTVNQGQIGRPSKSMNLLQQLLMQQGR